MVERQFVKGAIFQLLVVALVIGLISIVGGLLVAELVAQNVLHPGLAEVYNELLTAGDGNEI